MRHPIEITPDKQSGLKFGKGEERKEMPVNIIMKGFEASKAGKAIWECPYTGPKEVEAWLFGYQQQKNNEQI